MGWREEIATALGEQLALEGGARRQGQWRRLGRAVRMREPGVFTVDTRGIDVNPDQLDGLRLAGADTDSLDAGFPVLEARHDGSTLRVQVAEFAHPDDPHLWLLGQPPAFLTKALRDGIARLSEAPLGDTLARGEIGGGFAPLDAPPGMSRAQADAYRACLGSGVWLVWGPPGTGKTMVLRRAISDLLAAGRRVLLVSATNVAVDNALLGVLKERRHQPGEIVRVGPPHLREVAEDPQVSLPLMIRDRLALIDEQRRTVADQLRGILDRAEELATLDRLLADYAPATYADAKALLEAPGHSPDAYAHTLAARQHDVEIASAALADAEQALRAARQAVTDAADSRLMWAQLDDLRAQSDRVDEAAGESESLALLARQELAAAERELEELQSRPSLLRWRSRGALDACRERHEAARARSTEAEEQARRDRAVADRQRDRLTVRIEQLRGAIPFSQEEIARRDERARSAAVGVRSAKLAHEQAALRVREALDTQDRLTAARALVAEADRRGQPERHARAESLRPQVAAEAPLRAGLEKQHEDLQTRYEAFARDTQGEIIKGARLIATTLARFRTNKAVFDGPYDVVLVDEVGAATLPEVLLAVSRATTTAVLLGDFMQLGAVIDSQLKESTRSDVRRWLLPNVFQHCGIDSPAEAREHPGCVTLDTQHRFGHVVTDLANRLAYDGVLRAGHGVRERATDDPEVVLLDTDGLHELAQAHLTGRRSGWWPAGPLLSRALIDLHRDDGEEVGVVTPYSVQAEATLEALRDIEGNGGHLAEVGTAHRFQGREFPVVVFDTVEGRLGEGLWMAHASRAAEAGSWQRDGVRLFNVAVTRVQNRLYIIASRERVMRARRGTALAHVRDLLASKRLRSVQAAHLVAPPGHHEELRLGPFGARLAEVLERHVEVTEINDETSFYSTFATHLEDAQASIWLWAPWVSSRVQSLLPVLDKAVRRGVRVTVFVRDPSDTLQGTPAFAAHLSDLRAVVPTVVPINVMHQKIAVVDERTVLIGSLNTLSQRWTREVMLTIRGTHFARRVLAHEHAEVFADPPPCGACGQREIELRRRRNGTWYWRCYSGVCPAGTGNRAWKSDVELRPRRGRSARR
ncbi:AAA domain-containing protein [Allostreptomyces psammosilenae]|uniref:RecA/RadA recombinase n=1 Tax=Allostreptomyces psammosilenae TaxID=1892865 RepID=A0A852ZLY1_9ACTN|nr:AAA domain-containing protein [Allostreptomyces psammosilenae]NYI03416.1 RecA/RadA recombinase [Allostreptomyces psammosilenae]